MKSNITFISFVNAFARDVAKQVSDKLDLYYADINDFLAFNMVSTPQEVINTCGPEYLAKLEQDAVKTVASFENAVITVEARFFMNATSRHALKDGSVVIYLKMSQQTLDKYIKTIKNADKKLELENLRSVFEEYDKMCSRSSEIVIELKDLNVKATSKKAMKVINNYLG